MGKRMQCLNGTRLKILSLCKVEMPENRYASDIVKKNQASAEFVNRQVNYGDVAKGRTSGVLATIANTSASTGVSIAYGAQNTDPTVLSTVQAQYR
jgi:hypothetical protein